MSPPKDFFPPLPALKVHGKLCGQYQGKDLPREIHSMKLLIQRGFGFGGCFFVFFRGILGS